MAAIISGIIWGLIWGFATKAVIVNKGYSENWFWWGFFFGFIPFIIACCKPQCQSTQYYQPISRQPVQSYNGTGSYIQPGMYDQSNRPGAQSNGGWVCNCGRSNAAYVSTCICGRRKAEVTPPKIAISAISEQERSERLAKGGWECTCGTVNHHFITTCSCGKTKEEVQNTVVEAASGSDFVMDALVSSSASTVPEAELVAVTAAAAIPESAVSMADEEKTISIITKYKELLDLGAITQEDYDAKKKKLLGL